MRTTNSSICRAARFLKLRELRMRKKHQLELEVIAAEITSYGMLSILTKLLHIKRKDLIRTSVSTSTDHS
jgi:hypothetical protein